ncbi:co-chaperone YbbN [Anaeromyxobacter sp. Fw109-5]|uniref:thioredoxin family protein n=1 Tax=Anaeromyxobacter sp. (strain Fw109-5) TaxID=404589 RepID=UPI000158A48C|nr:thioredoxin family protein [Anaeromyxobacter sp. Fw109-5]ABS27825.1 Thioredoxin domain [Anaeromyxobacter sp. Fw109-5]
MTRFARAVSIAGVAAAVAIVLVARTAARTAPASEAASAPSSTPALPRLVDLGAGRCVPCKAMAPILEELKAEYAGRMDVQFIDVWQTPGAAAPYAIRMIPTQIFFGPDGRELARHEGFMAKAEILAQWKALGVSL